MKIKKKYTHNNKRQIFRLIPTDTSKLIIEERDTEKKQAYFNCLQIDNGKKIFTNLQLDEKYWLGIESVQNDIIFFHTFAKPDLPQHKGVIAFDINSKKIIWENKFLTYLFIKDDRVYAFQQGFENRQYVSLNCLTGEKIEELGSDSDSINIMRKETEAAKDYSSYCFPSMFSLSSLENQTAFEIINDLQKNRKLSGEIEYVLFNNLLMFNFHKINEDGSLSNIFNAVDLFSRKHILEVSLNSSTHAFAPDSFFVKDNLLFLLIERIQLKVYKLIS